MPMPPPATMPCSRCGTPTLGAPSTEGTTSAICRACITPADVEELGSAEHHDQGPTTARRGGRRPGRTEKAAPAEAPVE